MTGLIARAGLLAILWASLAAASDPAYNPRETFAPLDLGHSTSMGWPLVRVKNTGKLSGLRRPNRQTIEEMQWNGKMRQHGM